MQKYGIIWDIIVYLILIYARFFINYSIFEDKNSKYFNKIKDPKRFKNLLTWGIIAFTIYILISLFHGH